ncbi:MAG: hypothetical protein Q8L71_02195 [Thiobacillus sp.]|nr:hypothetical protein [Thiobacillus sp.]
MPDINLGLNEMNHLNPDTLRFILESAILAPSADNQHRVRFKLDQNAIRVTYTEPALPPPGGYKRALVLMSLGALVENLTIAASRFGIQAVTALYPDPNQPDWVLQTHLQPDQAVVDPLWQSISLRHTNRRVFFHGPQMSEAERGELDAAANAFPACQLLWLDDPAKRNHALRLMRLAETERFRTRLLHDELFSAIRFEAGWRETCPEGLPPGALGVEPPLRPIFALLRHWPAMRLANLLGAHYMLGWRACDLPCRLAPHLGLLAVKNSDDQSVYDVGRTFQRVWLAATSQGRVLQPMPASAIFALEGASVEGIPIATQHSLADGWKSSLGEAIPLMLFRTGFAKPLAVAAGRAGVEAYADTENG